MGTGPADADPVDIGQADTVTVLDAGLPDLDPVDTGSPDKGPADTHPADTVTGSNTDSTDTTLVHCSADIGPADIGRNDTMTSQDTGPADTLLLVRHRPPRLHCC